VLRKVGAMRKTSEAGAIGDAQQFKFVMFASPPPSDAEINGNLLVDALRRAIDAKRRRGGRPASTWRKKWGPIMVNAMQLAPQFTKEEFAQYMFNDPSGPELQKTVGVGSVMTIQNWLSDLSKGRTGVGRKTPQRAT
jgi:hypothetical protein